MITNNNYIYKQRIAKFLEMTFMAGTGKLFTCGRECYHIFSHFQTEFYLDFYTISGIQSINERPLQTDKQKQK